MYLFDEFDSIGSHRGQINDVGEIRRILNSFLQMIEQDDSDSIILAATNHPDILDYALFRRFDDVVEYSLPDTPLIVELLKNRLSTFKTSQIPWEKISDEAVGLSYADIGKACEDAIKNALQPSIIRSLSSMKMVSFHILEKSLPTSRNMFGKLKSDLHGSTTDATAEGGISGETGLKA